MFFIGIISEEKNEKYIKEMLKHNINNSNVIFINEKNIDNIKNDLKQFGSDIAKDAKSATHSTVSAMSNLGHTIKNDAKNSVVK